MAKTKVTMHKFTKYSYDKHKRLLSDIPQNIATRQQHTYNRNQMLAGTQAYNLRLEKQRIQSHLSDFVAPLQKAMAQHHMGDIDRRIHKLASSGLPWINITICKCRFTGRRDQHTKRFYVVLKRITRSSCQTVRRSVSMIALHTHTISANATQHLNKPAKRW